MDLVDEMKQRRAFGVVDYCVFVSVLVFSLMIGLYHACRAKQTNTEMLLGGRNMSILPVAISIMVSFLSAIMVLGSPAEVYTNGGQYWVGVLAFAFVLPTVCVFFLPIFYRCGLTSVYEYLQYRFDSTLLRGLCVLAYLVQTSLYMAIALYAPSLALKSTTTLSLEASIVCTGVVGTLYTTFGGLKAVVWADVLQAAVMGAGMVAIVVQGAVNVGGFANIFRISAERGRLDVFDFTMDPWQRHTFWNLFFGTYFMWITVMGVNQTSVQRYISLPTLKAAKIACILNAPANMLYISLASLAGLAIFASYADCDPVRMGFIERKDQLVPYFVLDQMSYITGLPGLFVACVLSGALSTISSGLNSLAAITWQDFVGNMKPFKMMSAAKQTRITRAISLMYGCLAVGMAFLVGQLGGVLQASLAITGAVSGPILGVFSLGIFVPFANGKGAVVGLLTAMSISMWTVFGAYGSGKRPEPLPTSIAGCSTNMTSLSVTTASPVSSTLDSPEPTDTSFVDQYIYGISYQLFHLLGCLVCVIVGSLFSLLTGCNRRKVRKSLINPLAYKLFNRFNRFCGEDSPEPGHAADNPAFLMPTYKQTTQD